MNLIQIIKFNCEQDKRRNKMALIECKNLTLSYENNLVLKNLSFSVENGDYIFIVGENGSGKSTLVKSLL